MSGFFLFFGGDIHVMLALRLRFRQVVVADKHLDGTDVVIKLFGKRQRTAHQTGYPLTQRVIKPFNVVGFAGFFVDRSVLSCWNYTFYTTY
jgi:hypothetical protein